MTSCFRVIFTLSFISCSVVRLYPPILTASFNNARVKDMQLKCVLELTPKINHFILWVECVRRWLYIYIIQDKNLKHCLLIKIKWNSRREVVNSFPVSFWKKDEINYIVNIELKHFRSKQKRDEVLKGYFPARRGESLEAWLPGCSVSRRAPKVTDCQLVNIL
jgi:hypothetical protein